MRYPGFIFGSYESQAVTADQERTINWYVEPMESEGATTQAALYPTPGVETVVESTSSPGRAHFHENGREFCVFGTTFYEVDSIGTLTSRGTVALDNNPATISSNGDLGNQLFVTSGGNGYYFDLTTNVLTQIAALNGIADMGAYLEGYFLALDRSSSTLYLSALGDGSSWTTGTDFAQRSIASDPWVSMAVLGRNLWLLGEYTSEVWYNSGGTFPLSFHPSGFVPYGCQAQWSAAVGANTLFWLGTSRSGENYILAAQGFEPQVISTFAVQKEIDGYSNVSDAQAFCYTDLGHTFYVISFPDADISWAYDVRTRSWAERATWISESSEWQAWAPRWYAFAFGEHRILSAIDGNLYRMGSEYTTDVAGREIRRLRRAPAIMDENNRIFYSEFEVDLEPGLGTVSGQGSSPELMMRFSNDGGKTWSNERTASAGKIGEYNVRVHWHRLGAARRRVFEVSVSDPIPWRITGAYLEIEREAGA